MKNDMTCYCDERDKCNENSSNCFHCRAQWNVKYTLKNGKSISERIGYWADIFSHGTYVEEQNHSPITIIYISGNGKNSPDLRTRWVDYYHENLVKIFVDESEYTFKQLAVLEQL